MGINTNYRILFVEDSKESLQSYLTYFQKYYKYCEPAYDELEAYDKYEAFKPNIIFLDINISKLNGLELLKKIRQNDTETKIIILTAYAEKNFVEQAIELGVTKYLLKPLTKSDLQETLTFLNY